MLDGRDHCPHQAGPVENAGCPDSDRDGDGLVDRRDACPDQYGPARLRGCRAADRDGDGIPDQTDRCPRRPEVWNGTRDFDGCPDRGRALLKVGKRRLQFAHNPRVLRSGKLDRRTRTALVVLGRAVRRLGLGRMELHVVAAYGRSYGDSIERSTKLGRTVLAALMAQAKLRPGLVRLVPRGPDGHPRVELRYR